MSRTSCSASGAPGKAASQAWRMCARYLAETSTGDSLRTSSGLPQGRIGAVRSAPACESQDFADATRRAGTSAPRWRAKAPTTSCSSPQGSARALGGSSPAAGM